MLSLKVLLAQPCWRCLGPNCVDPVHQVEFRSSVFTDPWHVGDWHLRTKHTQIHAMWRDFLKTSFTRIWIRVISTDTCSLDKLTSVLISSSLLPDHGPHIQYPNQWPLCNNPCPPFWTIKYKTKETIFFKLCRVGEEKRLWVCQASVYCMLIQPRST